jgi:hypothetical protein
VGEPTETCTDRVLRFSSARRIVVVEDASMERMGNGVAAGVSRVDGNVPIP